MMGVFLKFEWSKDHGSIKMSNSERLYNLIMNDDLPHLFHPSYRVNLFEAEYQLHETIHDLSLGVEDFIHLNEYCREIVMSLDGSWEVLTEHGFGTYVYRHPHVHMKSLVGSMFFKKNVRGSRMAISKRAHKKLHDLFTNTEMVLKLEAITKRLDRYFGLQVEVTRHISDEGYTTLNMMVEFDEWNQTALFRCLFGPDSAFSKS